MRNYNEKDISFYTEGKEGDLHVDESGDLAITADYMSARQDMANRIRTQTTDWRSHPDIGADLELLEGEVNTRDTGMRAERQVAFALSYDGRFDAGDIEVRSVPTQVDEIEVYAMVNGDNRETLIIKNTLDL